MFAIFTIFYASIFFHTASTASASACPDECSCNAGIIICDCTSGASSELHSLLLLPLSPQQVHITNCDTVHLYPWNGVSSATNPNVLNISNVQHLHIPALTFFRVSEMHELVIRDSNLESLEADSLGGIDGVQRFHLINVTAIQVPSHTFRNLTNVGDFLVTNSNLGILRGQAFSECENISSFTISHTIFKEFDTGSITLIQSHELIIANVSVSKWYSNALITSHVQSITVRHSKIHEMYQEAIAGVDGTSVFLGHNVIGTLHSSAFLGFRNLLYLNVTANLIGSPQNGSLQVDSSQVLYTNFDSNRFICKEQICWLLDAASRDPFYNNIINNSTCAAPLPFARKLVSEMNSLMDDVDTCGGGGGGGRDVDSSGYIPDADEDQRNPSNRLSVTTFYQNSSEETTTQNSTGNVVSFSAFTFSLSIFFTLSFC